MNIDAHQHFWRYDPSRHDWITEEMRVLKRDYLPGDLAPELGRCGLDASIAVQADQSEEETLFLLELAEGNPAIAGVVGWVDLRSPGLARRLEHFARFEKLRGFRHVAQSEPDDRFLVREDFTRGIAMLRAFDLTYDLLVFPRQLPAAIELAGRFPGQPFVLDHIAKPPIKARAMRDWASHIRDLASHPHVYCKLSGLVTEADWNAWRAEDFKPYLDAVCDAFGPDRVMFGSDWPVCLVAGSYARVHGVIADYSRNWTPEHREGLFGANAARFYGLKVFADGLTT